MTAAPAARALVLAVLVGAILVFDPREGHSGGRPKYLLVVAGAVAAAVLLLATARSRTPNPVRWPLAALLVWTAVSALASDHRRTAVYGVPGSYDGLLTTASFVLLFVATLRSFVPAGAVLQGLRVLWFGAGTTVLVFGLAQLADRLLAPDTGWDWARPAISPWTIGSTLGNPNHLGGLLAILLPIGVVLALLTTGRERIAVLAGAAVAIAELGITASRGAWLAAVAASASLALLLRRPRLLLVPVGAAALVALVLLVLGPTGAIKIEPAEVAETGPGTTLDLRLEVWSTALRVTADHPVLGVGPDVFTVVFPAYRSERFALLFGPFTVANGAHNLFLNTLANLGAVGLAALVAILATAARSVARRWPQGDAAIVAAGLVAALIAYVVQACFNTQQVALSVTFWVLLGMLLALGWAPAKEA